VRQGFELYKRACINEAVPQDSNMNSQYVEIVGQVTDESSIRMLSVLNIGDNMGEALKPTFVCGPKTNRCVFSDMKMVNNMIELMHHKEFAGVWH
jgi:hypothetical protein